MYSVSDLMYIHKKIGIPIVFDYHHHKFCTGDLTEQQALELAMSTWPVGITPAVHYSESAVGKKPQAHSDYIFEIINTYGNTVDIMVEAKKKDLTILKYKQENYGILRKSA
jgi:UV DNA damage endonuclease